jgi:hypothetical protein
MKQQLKYFLKNNIPACYLELLTYRAVSITKTPQKGSVISDLFVLRIEDGWETYVECLQFNSIFNPHEKANPQKVIFCFYTKTGQFITERDVMLPSAIKTTLNVNELVKDFNLLEDSLFAIFHPQKKQWITDHKSFLAERGYIGYANPNLGNIKGFVHGNLDAIARINSRKDDQLLGNYSFFKKEYHLQHSLDAGNTYELFLVNPTPSTQRFNIIQKTDQIKKEITFVIPSKGLYKHVLTDGSKDEKRTVIIESKLYLARPVVFKIMTSSFDVFHG